jgi:hypothetical protein
MKIAEIFPSEIFRRKNFASPFFRAFADHTTRTQAFIADISPQKIFSKAWMRIVGMTGIPTTTTQTEPVGVSSDLISFPSFSPPHTQAHHVFIY